MALSLAIKVDSKEITIVSDIPYSSGMSVQDAMESAYDLHGDPRYNFALRYYGRELGYEVIELDSLIQQTGSDPDTFVFWELLVNGEISQCGIDSTFPADGDQIEWNYTLYAEGRHSGTRYDKLRSATHFRRTSART